MLWSEGFDEVANPAKFTHNVPERWSVSTSGVSSGEARWNGWALSTIRDWTWAAGTDMRHWFTQAHGNVAIVDSKQQRLNETDSMTTALRSPEIPVDGETVNLEFDHHYRQGSPEQSAVVRVAFDGGEAHEAAVFSEDVFSKHESLELDVPEGAKTMQVEFVYRNGNDDWWWALDNVQVTRPLGQVGTPEAVVDVLSDVQGDPEDYQDAVRQLNGMEDKADALVLNGDLVDDGSEAQWDEFLAAHRAQPHDSGTELWTIGNHEMYGPEGSETYLQRFLEHSGQAEPWAEVMAGGVPLISINTEYYSDRDRGGKEPFQRLSEKQLGWLESRLGYWESQGITPLVFTHPLLPQTVSMSHSAWYQNDFEDLEALSEVLARHPNIVAFTSHSHSSLRQNNWWGTYRYKDAAFPVVNTGAILNEYLPDGDHDEKIVKEKDEASSGLRVKVYPDRVRVEAWDFQAGKMLKYQDFPR
ncbi:MULTISPECIES: metallophosphoesterase [unclassified Corynebacterium]|uniref:metallophosphoesterase family protein n=1 Tax=unclassified Corynebacterium TaxID=2624378 RepID=UPI0034CFFBE9